MDSQPEALRLANLLKKRWNNEDVDEKLLELKAAAELQRLHESNSKLLRAIKLARGFIFIKCSKDSDWNLHQNLDKLLKEEGGE